MKVMTFNTQHCLNYITQKIDFDVMAQAIISCDPDVVSLNEMRGAGEDPEYTEQVERLAELTGMTYFYFAPAIYFSGKGPYGNGILSKIPILSVKTVIIPDPVEKIYNSEYYETRCVLVAELEGGVKVLITHIGLNPDEKLNAVLTIVKNLSDEKCILMGDFNMRPDDKMLTPIFERMTDAAEGFCSDKFSFPSDDPDRKIDYVFVSRDAKVISADIPAITASDHRPHTACIEF